jgi:Leucine-rich repeat (LRR) protein
MSLEKLEYLSLSNNKIEGIKNLFYLTNLTVLYLSTYL